MFILGNILIGFGKVLHILLNFYMWIVIIGALISWVNPDPYNPIVRFLQGVTYPLFYWLRRRIPLVIGGIDLSPIIVIAVIVFLDYAVASTIMETGMRLKGGF
ncbi:MAG TPA: YggT family protein [Desulfomonilia bacterium]|nr:YggT family protein [Desulfomonilia bacterium]